MGVGVRDRDDRKEEAPCVSLVSVAGRSGVHRCEGRGGSRSHLAFLFCILVRCARIAAAAAQADCRLFPRFSSTSISLVLLAAAPSKPYIISPPSSPPSSRRAS